MLYSLYHYGITKVSKRFKRILYSLIDMCEIFLTNIVTLLFPAMMITVSQLRQWELLTSNMIFLLNTVFIQQHLLYTITIMSYCSFLFNYPGENGSAISI